MSKISRSVVMALSAFFASAGAGSVYAAPDGHEQARQLLQRPHVTVPTEASPAIGFLGALPQDGHEQARRLLERASLIGKEGGVQYEGAVLVVKPEPALDAHTQARNLLARPLKQ